MCTFAATIKRRLASRWKLEQKIFHTGEELLHHRKEIPSRDAEQLYPPTIFSQGYLYNPYGSPRVETDPQPTVIIRTVRARESPASGI